MIISWPRAYSVVELCEIKTFSPLDERISPRVIHHLIYPLSLVENFAYKITTKKKMTKELCPSIAQGGRYYTSVTPPAAYKALGL